MAVQIRSTGNLTSTVPDLRTSEMRVMLMEATRHNQVLQESLEALRHKVREYERTVTQGAGALGLLRTEQDSARLLAGITPVRGPGSLLCGGAFHYWCKDIPKPSSHTTPSLVAR